MNLLPTTLFPAFAALYSINMFLFPQLSLCTFSFVIIPLYVGQSHLQKTTCLPQCYTEMLSVLCPQQSPATKPRVTLQVAAWQEGMSSFPGHTVQLPELCCLDQRDE